MRNIEVLTRRLNACKHPRAIYNALLALASSSEVQSAEDPIEAICHGLTKRETMEQEVSA